MGRRWCSRCSSFRNLRFPKYFQAGSPSSPSLTLRQVTAGRGHPPTWHTSCPVPPTVSQLSRSPVRTHAVGPSAGVGEGGGIGGKTGWKNLKKRLNWWKKQMKKLDENTQLVGIPDEKTKWKHSIGGKIRWKNYMKKLNWWENQMKKLNWWENQMKKLDENTQ